MINPLETRSDQPTIRLPTKGGSGEDQLPSQYAHALLAFTP